MTNIDKYPRPVKWISEWMGHGTRKSSFVLFFSFCYVKEVKGVREHGPPAPPLPLIYLLKVNNRNTRTRGEICLKLTIKIPERRHWPFYIVYYALHLKLPMLENEFLPFYSP